MRIVAGEWRGRRLFVPRSGTRPTADRVRQILFDILGSRVAGASVLDLYAGTGALGLEALSRGARNVVFVETARSARLVLERNCLELQAGDRARIVGRGVREALPRLESEGASFDLVLADPPYGDPETPMVLAYLGLETITLLAAGGRVVLESDRRAAVPEAAGRLQRERIREVGATALHFFRCEEAAR